ncbi:BED zinc finger [Phytophthora infestans]|uniref:BED zinc finger n=1 Tax=Phytophthora infestans TaxID=4787 RepID=A0A833SR47_PHYIN|nr:BED zinc finger [Phytophthora infestans]
MARKRDHIWDYFTDHPMVALKSPRARCNFCGDTVSASVTNTYRLMQMLAHVLRDHVKTAV